jgi:hypothetical protein
VARNTGPNLVVYTDRRNDKRRDDEQITGTTHELGTTDVKMTMSTRTIANPRRTTLAHLRDADELTAEAVAPSVSENADELPAQTANPQRTVLQESSAN